VKNASPFLQEAAMLDRRRLLPFIAIAFGGSWLVGLVFYLLGAVKKPAVAMALAILYMQFPMVAAFVVQKLVCEEPLVKPLGLSFRLNRWWVVGWLLPAVITLLATGISLLLPGVEYSPGMEGFFEQLKDFIPPEQLELMKQQVASFPVRLFWIALFQGLIAGATFNALVAFGEELGWRGFLQKEFAGLGFWRSSALIGVIWGLWHAPLVLQGVNYPYHPLAGVFMMVLFTTLLAPLFSYVRLKSGSVIAAAVMHGSLNGVARIPVLVVKGSNLLIGPTGLAGFLALSLLDLGLWLYQRLRREERETLL